MTDLTEVDDSITDFVWTLCTDFDVDTDVVADVMFIDCSTRLLFESFTLATSMTVLSMPLMELTRTMIRIT